MSDRRWSQASAEAQGFVIGRLKTELIDLKKDHAGLAGPALVVAQAREEAVTLAIEALYLARVEVAGAAVLAEPAMVGVGSEQVIDVGVAEVVEAIRDLGESRPDHGIVQAPANVIPQLPHAGHPARASFGAHPGLIAHVPFGAATALASPGEGAAAVPTRDIRVVDGEGRCLIVAGDVVRHKPTAKQDVVMLIRGKLAYFTHGGVYKLTDLERV